MGIRGLETFLDSFYNNDENNFIFELKKLKELKLVIDGNQFSHVLSSMFKLGSYGGNYDIYYEKVKALLSKLKDSIEMVVFDGAKENLEKAEWRLKQKVFRNANISTENSEKSEIEKKIEHFNNLISCPSLFNRMVLYKVLNDLNISYIMCEGLADHVIAVYANGFNKKEQTFTVMSKASFFNVYHLKGGYLSTKYVMEKFKDIENLNQDTEFSVFYLDKLLKHFCLENKQTWEYFCILLGNKDDEELPRNISYFKAYNIDTRHGNFLQLLSHLKIEEGYLQKTYYQQIRSTYKSKNALKKIDELIELFEMTNTNYDIISPSSCDQIINDFDRMFATINTVNANFVNCIVEDFKNEKSAFLPAIDLMQIVYAFIWDKSNQRFRKVNEFIRLKEPSLALAVEIRSRNYEDFNAHRNNNRYFSFLSDASEKVGSINLNDSLTLLFVSMIIWEEWLTSKHLLSSTEEHVNAILTNFLVITIKLALRNKSMDLENVKQKDLNQDIFVKFLDSKIKNNKAYENSLNDIVNTYDEFVNQIEDINSIDMDDYFANDIPEIHKLSVMKL
jgi:hypothetical protein